MERYTVCTTFSDITFNRMGFHEADFSSDCHNSEKDSALLLDLILINVIAPAFDIKICSFGKSFAITLTSFYNVFSKIIANFVKYSLLKRLLNKELTITQTLVLTKKQNSY
jgi:hypothetical protein